MPVLASAPILLWVIWFGGFHWRPFWAHFYDPEAIFFFSGQAVLAGEPPTNVDHPGLITSYMSGIIQLASGTSGIDLDPYRRVGYCVTASLAICACLLSVRFLRDLPVSLRITATWAFFAAPRMLEMLTVFTTEAIYPLFLALFGVSIGAAAKRPVRSMLFALGAAFGALISLKFLFLAWIPALGVFLLLCGPLRSSIHRLAIVFGGALLAFFVIAIPALSKLSYIVQWLTRLVTNSGIYGAGPTEPPSLSSMYDNLSNAFSSAMVWHALIVCGFVSCVVLRSRKRADVSSALLWFCVLAYFGTLLTITRNFYDGRYLLPVAFMPVLLVYMTRKVFRGGWFPSAALSLLLAAFFLKASLAAGSAHLGRIRESTLQREAIQAALRNADRSNEPVIFGWRVPEPSFAMRIFAWGTKNHEALAVRYPAEGHYDPWRRIIFPPSSGDWKFAVINRSELKTFPGEAQIVGEVGEFVILRRAIQGESRSTVQAPRSRR